MDSNRKKGMFFVTILCSSIIFSSKVYADNWSGNVLSQVNMEQEEKETKIAYADVRTFLYVRKEPTKQSPWIGKLYPQEEMILDGPLENWTRIKWGSEVGYVYSKYICMKEQVSQKSIEQDDEEGDEIVKYACQFIGNPYVWGGTSLTKGADCSGFVQSVFHHFGIDLPRTSGSMRTAGSEVSYHNAQPGDIICYDGHVGIYMGDGKIVNAINKKRGIGILSATYDKIITVRRIF